MSQFALSQTLTIPDFWQQEAVHALRAGKDVVVHAPTGAGKTFIFELLYPELRGQAVFTVPTRALANDKLAEWRTRGWDVGIATGDVSHRLDARVVVATLETQKGRFLEQRGPTLLVIDEYQMIGDPVRGVNYELAIALAPPETQLLLLSGSVANPKDVADWLQRIGRQAVLVTHRERPVPLTEIDLTMLPDRAPANLRTWWPRRIANALLADLGPILFFAPRRHAAEQFAEDLAAATPAKLQPLPLTRAQEQLAGSRLARLLRRRVAFHHSGLSYAQRAELIEPLAKAGELLVVVATMGLAAGINFSMRSVVISSTSYMAGPFERQVEPGELLQMYGRAGRRGLDEQGYALVTPQPPRLLDARPRTLRRAQQVDWPTLIAVMHGAALRGNPPYEAALHLNERLFTLQKIPLGIEHSLATGPMPCGLSVDMERARFARRGVAEMLNSRLEWEPLSGESASGTLGELLIWHPEKDAGVGEAQGRWVPALALPETLRDIGPGMMRRVESANGKRYGREVILGTRREGAFSLAPWLRKALRKTEVNAEALQNEVLRALPELAGGATVARIEPRGDQLAAILHYDRVPVTEARRDLHGALLRNPPQREELPLPCRAGGPGGGPCVELAWCRTVEIVRTTAQAWRALGLIEADGRPTRRGVIFSYFHHGEGFAVAAALEDESYPIDDLVFDLANLRGGARFAGDDSPYSGRLASLCQRVYARADHPGYLEMGVPVDYSAGAGDAIREMIQHGLPRQKLATEMLQLGDIERALVEWRSLLRHIVFAPEYEWERWRALKAAAGALLAT